MTDHGKPCMHMQNSSRAVFCVQRQFVLILSAKLEILFVAMSREMDFLNAQPTDMLKKAILDMRKKIKRLEADNDELNEKCASLQNELEHLRPTKGKTLRLDPAADPRDIAEGAEANGGGEASMTDPLVVVASVASPSAATAERSKATLARPHKRSALASSQAAEPPLKSARSVCAGGNCGDDPSRHRGTRSLMERQRAAERNSASATAAYGSEESHGQGSNANIFASFRNQEGQSILVGKLGKPEHHTDHAAEFVFSQAALSEELLRWLQSDPTLPTNAADMKRRFRCDRATKNAEQYITDTKIQVMGHTGPGAGLAGSCNGLDTTVPAPERLSAFSKAFKHVANGVELLRLHEKLVKCMKSIPDAKLGENGRRLRDITPEGFLDAVFHFVMIQVMLREEYREDKRHCDGGASLLHMGLSLIDDRYLRFWEKDKAESHEVQLPQAAVYISSPSCFSHQTVHRDGPQSGTRSLEHGSLSQHKWAIQFRCCLWNRGRATSPPAMPIEAFQKAAGVVATWLASAKLRLPSLSECEAILRTHSAELLPTATEQHSAPQAASPAAIEASQTPKQCSSSSSNSADGEDTLAVNQQGLSPR